MKVKVRINNLDVNNEMGNTFNLTANIGSVNPSIATLTNLLSNNNEVTVDNNATIIYIQPVAGGLCNDTLILPISNIPTTTTTSTTTSTTTECVSNTWTITAANNYNNAIDYCNNNPNNILLVLYTTENTLATNVVLYTDKCLTKVWTTSNPSQPIIVIGGIAYLVNPSDGKIISAYICPTTTTTTTSTTTSTTTIPTVAISLRQISNTDGTFFSQCLGGSINEGWLTKLEFTASYTSTTGLKTKVFTAAGSDIIYPLLYTSVTLTSRITDINGGPTFCAKTYQTSIRQDTILPLKATGNLIQINGQNAGNTAAIYTFSATTDASFTSSILDVSNPDCNIIVGTTPILKCLLGELSFTIQEKVYDQSIPGNLKNTIKISGASENNGPFTITAYNSTNNPTVLLTNVSRTSLLNGVNISYNEASIVRFVVSDTGGCGGVRNINAPKVQTYTNIFTSPSVTSWCTAAGNNPTYATMCVFIPDGANPIANGTRWYKDETITTRYIFDITNGSAGYGISGSSGPYEKYHTTVGYLVYNDPITGTLITDTSKTTARGGYTCPPNP